MNAAYIIDCDPTEEYYLIFDGDVNPTDEGWALNGTNWATSADSILTIDEAHTAETSFQKALESHSASDTLTVVVHLKTDGSTVGAVCKLHSSTLGVGGRFEVAAAGGSVDFYDDSGDTNHVVDFTAGYVWIKMKLTATTFDAWVGDTQVVTAGTPYATAENFVFFGKESSSSGGNQYWDYVEASYTATYRDGYNKAASSSCTISSDQEDSDWPLTYLTNGIPSKGTYFDDNEGIELDIDFGTSEQCTCIAFIGHNLTPGARVKIENDDNASQTSPDLEYYVGWSKDQIIIMLDSNNTNRYWRISIDDPENSENILIGELVMGNYYEFAQNFYWGLNYSKKTNNVSLKTPFGQQWSYHMNTLEELSGINFSMIEDQTVEELFDMFEGAKGSHYPLLFIWSDTDEDRQRSIYGKLSDSMSRNLTFLDVNEVTGLKVIGMNRPKTLEDEA